MATEIITPIAREIKWDSITSDFACFVEGEFIGYAHTYADGEQKCNTFVYERLEREAVEQADAEAELDAVLDDQACDVAEARKRFDAESQPNRGALGFLAGQLVATAPTVTERPFYGDSQTQQGTEYMVQTSDGDVALYVSHSDYLHIELFTDVLASVKLSHIEAILPALLALVADPRVQAAKQAKAEQQAPALAKAA